jgi:hypothetical protein
MEHWPQDERPSTIIYLCGTLADVDPASTGETGTLPGQRERVRHHLHSFLSRGARQLLPRAYEGEGFAWEELVGAGDAVGSVRLESQFWSANVDPSDRYVLSLPGTDRFRLRPDRSGFANLFLTGDWTDCGLNAGCIEAAVISGLQAANAVTGEGRWSDISGNWQPLVGSQ